MFLVTKGFGSDNYVSLGLIGAEAQQSVTGSLITMGLGTDLMVTQGYSGTTTPSVQSVSGSIITMGLGTNLMVTQGYLGTAAAPVPPTPAVASVVKGGGKIITKKRDVVEKDDEEEQIEKWMFTIAVAQEIIKKQSYIIYKNINYEIYAEMNDVKSIEQKAEIKVNATFKKRK